MTMVEDRRGTVAAWQQVWVKRLLLGLAALSLASAVTMALMGQKAGSFSALVVAGLLLALRFWRGVAYRTQAVSGIVVLYGFAVAAWRGEIAEIGHVLLTLSPFVALAFLGRGAATVTLIVSMFGWALVAVLGWGGWLEGVAMSVMGGVLLYVQGVVLSRFEGALADGEARAHSLEASLSKVQEDLEEERELRRKLARAAALGRMLCSAPHQEEVLRRLAEALVQMFGAYRVHFFAATARGGDLVLRVVAGEREEGSPDVGWHLTPAEALLPNRVARVRRYRVRVSTLDTQRYFPRSRFEAALPVIVDDELLGVLDLHRDGPPPFSEAEMQVLEAVVGYATAVLRVVQRLGEMEARLQEMQALYAEGVSASWEDLLALEGLQDYVRGEVPQEVVRSLAEEAVRRQEPRVAHLEEGYVLVLPLMARGVPLGYLVFTRSEERGAWDPQTLSVLGEAVERLALALDSTRLLAESRQRAYYEEQLGRFTELVWGSLRVEAIMEHSVRELGRLLGAGDVTMALISEREVWA